MIVSNNVLKNNFYVNPNQCAIRHGKNGFKPTVEYSLYYSKKFEKIFCRQGEGIGSVQMPVTEARARQERRK